MNCVAEALSRFAEVFAAVGGGGQVWAGFGLAFLCFWIISGQDNCNIEFSPLPISESFFRSGRYHEGSSQKRKKERKKRGLGGPDNMRDALYSLLSAGGGPFSPLESARIILSPHSPLFQVYQTAQLC